ncbi:MAG TPA: MBL fold metallo-hydrolase [Phycisphaerales bacterium]|nr:MBL fold metallo-hydrolase [Phycisphaerales bacterium]
MLLRQIYDDRLAQAAYLIGCQRTGEAIIVDPERDVDRYIRAAAKEGLKISTIAETHIHADFLSGARELAEKTGARVYLSAEGGTDWQYQWLDKRSGGGAYNHKLLKHGDSFMVGGIEFRAIHTPGHTPEHLCYAVTDRGGGASEPMGILTGDFVFVGDVGRPDLLETAAGQAGTSEPSARSLYASLREFVKLPEYVQVWPAHGAGSACGKALGAVPQTTVGYEKRFNPAINATKDERGFVDFILAGQPEPPLYFARMKRENKIGPRVLGDLPRPEKLDLGAIRALDTKQTAVVDTRPWQAFKAGHLAGSLLAPLDSMFHAVTGSYIGADEPIVLVAEEPMVEELVRNLVRIGLDKITGWINHAGLTDFVKSGGRLATTPEIDPAAARGRSSDGGMFLLDVRRAEEFGAGHIPGAMHTAYPRLPDHLDALPKDRPILVNCRSGARSARAAAYLQRLGYDATNLGGGFIAWEQEGGEVEKPMAARCGA